MSIIARNKVVRDIGKFVTEASDIGLRPGYFPERLLLQVTSSEVVEYHEPRPIFDREHDLQAMVYRSVINGPELHVIND